ncbi:hypothetical protein [Paracoccus sp. Ld10]|uniref:hypothetical protein n=1 Tax=Paracoccus sp. Ld10 TaxID=649158 RepID=UPI003868C8C4
MNDIGLRECPEEEYWPAKTLYGRWQRRRDDGLFARIMVGLATKSADPEVIMIDTSYLMEHRTACSLSAKKQKRPPDRSNESRHEPKAARRY